MAEKEVNIAIFGAGSLGKAYAGKAASLGYGVNLYNRSPDRTYPLEEDNKLVIGFDPEIEGDLYPNTNKRSNFEPIKDKKGFKRGLVELNRVCSGKYVEDAFDGDPDVLLVATTARGHKDIAKKIARYLRDNHIVLLSPGRMLGALEFRNEVKGYYEKRNRKMPNVIIGETDTSLFACRVEKHDQKNVRIHGVKNRVNFATIPSKDAKNIIEPIENIFRQFKCYLDDGSLINVLHTSLGNVGGIFHVPIMILNSKDISNKKKFKFYVEGLNPLIAGFLDELDDERIKLANKMRIHVEPAIEWLEREYGSEGATLYEAFQNTDAYQDLLAPDSINVRQLTEEVPCSLIPMKELAEKARTEYKTTEAFIQLAYVLIRRAHIRRGSEKNILKKARTMESLGLKELNIKGIKNYLITGIYPQDEKFFAEI